MIVKRDIENLLADLELYYSSHAIPRSTHYSKLAVIELCGWIEESFDKIAKRCIKSKLKTQTFNQIFDNSTIGGNHGFTYKKHFRKMMISTIGIVNTEKLVMDLTSSGELSVMESTLNILKLERDRAAHTTAAGTTVTYQAPSITKQQLTRLYPIIRKISSFAVKYHRDN